MNDKLPWNAMTPALFLLAAAPGHWPWTSGSNTADPGLKEAK